MQTEHEKNQAEISRLQLEQERIKLAQLQRRQRAVDAMRGGAVAVGQGAVNWVSRILVALLTSLLSAVALTIFFAARLAAASAGTADFPYTFGNLLGVNTHIFFSAVMVCAGASFIVSLVSKDSFYAVLPLGICALVGGVLLSTKSPPMTDPAIPLARIATPVPPESAVPNPPRSTAQNSSVAVNSVFEADGSIMPGVVLYEDGRRYASNPGSHPKIYEVVNGRLILRPSGYNPSVRPPAISPQNLTAAENLSQR